MSIEFLLMIGVVLILLLIGIIFFIPADKNNSRKKKKVQEDLQGQKNDLEEKVARMEKNMRSLRDEILVLQKDGKVKEKELMTERVKVKKFQEKLSQERAWHNKEKDIIDKKGKEFQDLKEELRKVQESFSAEHTGNIRLERALKELTGENGALNDQRRRVEAENAQYKVKMENNRKEILQLKKEVAELSRKKEDVQWVAKAEHDRVLQLLREKEKEIQRMERELAR